MNPEITTLQLLDWELIHACLKEKNAENKIFSSSFFGTLSADENRVLSCGIAQNIYKLSPPLFHSVTNRHNDYREKFWLPRIPADNTNPNRAAKHIPPTALLAGVRYFLIKEAQAKGESPEELFRKYSVDL